MRILLNVKIPPGPFNAAVKDGTVGAKLQKIIAAMKAEAIYFTDQHGCRGAVVVVNISDSSQVPALAEPWFLTFNAEVQFHVAMTPDDLAHAGLEKIGKEWT